ncbi:MAG: DNA-methyltransferase [Gammaproteobacteria bacterium WSBS_2016_MAG_OTU1]
MPAKTATVCWDDLSQAAAGFDSFESQINKVQCCDILPAMQAIKQHDIFDVVIADPPYNIGKDFGNNFDSKELPDYLDWCDAWIAECLRLTKISSPIYIYGYPEILAHIAVRQPIDKQRWMVWHYTNKAVPSSKFWQRSHESILCIWKGERPHINVDKVREKYTDTFLKNAAGKVRNETSCRYSNKGKKTIYEAHPQGALPRDVIKVSALAGGAGYAERWFYCKTCRRLCNPRERRDHLSHDIIRHPTQKPMGVSKKLLASATSSGDYALIPFAGSGSECVIAQSMGINFFATDINSDYVYLANEWLDNGTAR